MRQENIVNLFLISCSVLFAGLSLSLISPFYWIGYGHRIYKTLIFTPVCGKYIQVLGAKKFLITGSFIVGLGNFMFGFLSKLEDKNTFLSLSILTRFIIAIGQAAAGPAAYTLAGKQVTEKNRGKAISAAEACFGIGTIVRPTLGGCLYDVGCFSFFF